MADTRRHRIKELFNDAIELDGLARDAFVMQSCEDDAMRVEVQVMIDAHERAGSFLVDPTLAERPLDETIGHYRLIRSLGEGGFGQVYLAEQHEPVARRVAIKIVKPGMDTQEVMSRFDAERQTLAMMNHPGIAMVFDAGATSTGRSYFVMEYVDGVPITEFCDQRRLSIEDRIALFNQTCTAVQHAHAKGIIHRDLKPSNVLVTTHAGDALPKIIDFGIAKATSAAQRSASRTAEQRLIVGTPQYMSPEQFTGFGNDVDTRADVYSLGVMLYELLTGTTPLDADQCSTAGPAELQQLVCDEAPIKPSTRVSSWHEVASVAAKRSTDVRHLTSKLQGDLDWIALKALEKNRDQRYHSASELADDLRRHLRHEPVRAHAPSAPYLMRKFIRRHWIGMTAGSVVALAMLIGILGLTIGLMRAWEATANSQQSAARALSVNAFMHDVLTSAEPDARGADVRLLDVLDDASQLAGERFANQPDQEAAARMMLGQVYRHFSKWRLAGNEFKQAAALFASVHGNDDQQTIDAELRHASMLLSLNFAGEAESVLDRIKPSLTRAVANDDELAFQYEVVANGVLIRQGEHEQARANLYDLDRRALAADVSNATHIEILNTLILAMHRMLVGEHVDAAVFEEIESIAREMADRAERELGADALLTIRARTIVADMLFRQGKAQAAADICEPILASTETRLGPCHNQRIQTMETLAKALNALGNAASAADLQLQQIDCARGRQDIVVLISTISDALPYLDRGGRWIEGEALAREYADTLTTLGGGHGEMQTLAQFYIARFLSLQQRTDEAAAIFEPLIARSASMTDDRVRARLHLFHALNLIDQQRFDDAEHQLDLAASLLPDIHLGTTTVNPDDVINGYIAINDARGRQESADSYRAMRSSPVSGAR